MLIESLGTKTTHCTSQELAKAAPLHTISYGDNVQNMTAGQIGFKKKKVF